MKKTVLLVLLSMVLAFGMMVIGCSDGSGGPGGGGYTPPPGGGGGGGHLPATNGKLTITGLSSYNGKYVLAMTDNNSGPNFFAGAGWDLNSFIADAVKISGGSATLKVWIAPGDPSTATAYSGSDSNVLLGVAICNKSSVYMDSEEWLVALKFATINFTNGVGTGDWSTFSDHL